MVRQEPYWDEDLERVYRKLCKLEEKPKKKSFIEKHWLKITVGGVIAGYLLKSKLESKGIPVPDVDPEPEWLGRECLLKGLVKSTGEELLSVDCSESFINDLAEITKDYADTIEVTEF